MEAKPAGVDEYFRCKGRIKSAWRLGQAAREMSMFIKLSNSVIRSWKMDDADALLKHSNNFRIWRNFSQDFPRNYTRAVAVEAIRHMLGARPETWFAIAVDDEAIGAIGLDLGSGSSRCSAELGYWVSELCWGRGIATEAVAGFTEYAMGQYGLSRIFATVFEWNPASMRVLEKCGYIKEGVLRQSIVKEGRVLDQMLYAHVAQSPLGRWTESMTSTTTDSFSCCKRNPN